MRIRQDKYEKQLLKTFDFTAWIESKLTNILSPGDFVANRLVYIGKTVIQGIISVIYLQREKEYMPTFVKKINAIDSKMCRLIPLLVAHRPNQHKRYEKIIALALLMAGVTAMEAGNRIIGREYNSN